MQPRPPRRSKARIAQRSVRDAFYAGLYGDVIARTIDTPSFSFGGDDTPLVIGALAFLGRIEEANAALITCEREGAPSSARVAAHFFLGVAYCRAGRYAEAQRIFCANRALAHRGDPITRFYLHQGLACFRYFTGAMHHAARHTLRALACAFEGRFQYGRLLATDLRGHALTQLGRIREGLALLEQARDLAVTLGLTTNAEAIACATAIYAASRIGAPPLDEGIARLEAASEAITQDSYSRRTVRLELARQYALAGRGDAARTILEQVTAARLPDGDQRARVRLLLASAFVALLRDGARSGATYCAEARRSLEQLADTGLELEVLSLELLCTDPDPERIVRQAELVRRTKLGRAGDSREFFSAERDAWLADGDEEISLEDRPSMLLRIAIRGSLDARLRLIRDGYLGLVPRSLGLDPGRRLLLTGPSSLLVEERGNVRLRDDIPEGGLRLLRALADGAWHEKEALVRTVWRLPSYRPDRHDPLVHTAVSRLRAALGTAGHWIEGLAGAYRIAPGVSLVDVIATLASAGPAAEHDSDEATAEGAARPAPSTIPPRMETAEQTQSAELLDALARQGELSTADIARLLSVSEMTAFRRLRSLLDSGAVVRSGKGRKTRYTVAQRARTEDLQC